MALGRAVLAKGWELEHGDETGDGGGEARGGVESEEGGEGFGCGWGEGEAVAGFGEGSVLIGGRVEKAEIRRTRSDRG